MQNNQIMIVPRLHYPILFHGKKQMELNVCNVNVCSMVMNLICIHMPLHFNFCQRTNYESFPFRVSYQMKCSWSKRPKMNFLVNLTCEKHHTPNQNLTHIFLNFNTCHQQDTSFSLHKVSCSRLVYHLFSKAQVSGGIYFHSYS